jgi:hypothetical protein
MYYYGIYIDGWDLAFKIQNQKFSETPFEEYYIRSVFRQCSSAQQECKKRIIRPDLNRENVLLTSSVIVTLGNFLFSIRSYQKNSLSYI